jgi:hypothetical protein
VKFDSLNAAARAFVAACLAAMLLSGCGGSKKDDDGNTPNPGPQNQTIAFTNAGPLSGLVGTTITNTASGGGGAGSISYASSNTAVATVSANGVATLASAGSVTITATKAASTGFNQATASYTINVTPGSQTIAFAQTGSLFSTIGAALNNSASGGLGTGAITYTSSDMAVATVDSTTGAAIPLTLGSTTITATKAADANYLQAQTTYTLNVVPGGAVTAWIGSTATDVNLVASANGASFVRARNRNCDPANYLACTLGQSTLVSGAPAATFTDTAAVIGTPAHYWLRSGTFNSSPLTVATSRFSERIGHTAVYFNNRYWVMGGSLVISAGAQADVWSSADGKTWVQETNAAPFGARWLHQSVVYDNKIWVIGGVTAANGLWNNTYSSPDGLNWTLVSSNAPGGSTSSINVRVTVFNNAMWAVVAGTSYSSTDGITWTARSALGAIHSTSFRSYASLTAYNGQLWYMGGSIGLENMGGNTLGDVWRSADGINWTSVTGAAAFGSRYRHSTFVLNNRLWVFGGQQMIGGVAALSRSAWSTTDGLNWTQEAQTTQVDDSMFAEVIQEAGRVMLIGGVQRVFSNGVYQSSDGNNWNELSASSVFPSRAAHRSISFAGDLWMIGGTTLAGGSTSEVWRSSDGLNWNRVTTVGTIFSRRSEHQLAVFNGRLWVIGGWDDSNSGGTGTRLNDVWSTADGINWRLDTANAGFSPRINFGVADFNGRLWVVGGSTATNTNANDVWSSVDGQVWIQETANAAFAARNGLKVVALNSALWVLGGYTTAYVNDIWTSANGVTWTQVTPTTASFSARSSHEAVIHNNRMWVVAGTTGPYPTSGILVDPNLNDVWSSADGLSWTQHTGSAPFERRGFFGLAVNNNELWVIGGLGIDRHGDVWRSADGANWRTAFIGTIQFP